MQAFSRFRPARRVHLEEAESEVERRSDHEFVALRLLLGVAQPTLLQLPHRLKRATLSVNC